MRRCNSYSFTWCWSPFQRALQYSLLPPGSVWPLLCVNVIVVFLIRFETSADQSRLHSEGYMKSPLCCVASLMVDMHVWQRIWSLCVSLSDVTFTHPEALMWKGCFSEVSFISDDSKCLFFLSLIVAFLLDDCNKKPKGRHQPYYMIPVAPADVGLDPTITVSDGARAGSGEASL